MKRSETAAKSRSLRFLDISRDAQSGSAGSGMT